MYGVLRNILCLWVFMLLCGTDAPASTSVAPDLHSLSEFYIHPVRPGNAMPAQSAALSVVATVPAGSSAETGSVHHDQKFLSAARLLPGRAKGAAAMPPADKRLRGTMLRARPADYFVFTLERILI